MTQCLFTRPRLAVLLAFAAGAAMNSPLFAGSLVWNLPPAGTEVVYGGKVSHVTTGPDGKQRTITWDKQLRLRALGAEEVTVDGEQVSARWIEFEVRTGQRTEQGIQKGPVGRSVYRLLVPESAITGKVADEHGIPATFLPILEGYQQLGEGPAEKLTGSVFETFPVVAQLMNYKPEELQPAGETPIKVPAGEFTATKYTASATSESLDNRGEHKATLFVSEEMPFGLVQWQVTINRSDKEPGQGRDAFAPLGTITVEMKARAINENAQAVITPQ